jgi:hypothetical protein
MNELTVLLQPGSGGVRTSSVTLGAARQTVNGRPKKQENNLCER